MAFQGRTATLGSQAPQGQAPLTVPRPLQVAEDTDTKAKGRKGRRPVEGESRELVFDTS